MKNNDTLRRKFFALNDLLDDEGLDSSEKEKIHDEMHIHMGRLNGISEEEARSEYFEWKAQQKEEEEKEKQFIPSREQHLYYMATNIAKVHSEPTGPAMYMLKGQVARYIDSGETMPKMLARFAVEQLKSGTPFKWKNKGRRMDDRVGVHRFIYVELVKSTGLALRDSAENKGAFSTVAEQREVTPEHVEMQWTEFYRHKKKTKVEFERLLTTLSEDEVKAIRVGQQESEDEMKRVRKERIIHL